MKGGIGEGKTRGDHSSVNNQLYASYARGRRIQNLVAVIGDESLSPADRLYLTFADRFEDEFVRQRHNEGRSIEETLFLAWKLLSIFPKEELKRIGEEDIERYYISGGA
jgi:V/A-type H+-transporting ATPase subunit B